MEGIENLKKILEANPCHLSRKLDMRRLNGIKAGEGQFRIRTKQYQLRDGIFGQDPVMYSFRHRKDIYEFD